MGTQINIWVILAGIATVTLGLLAGYFLLRRNIPEDLPRDDLKYRAAARHLRLWFVLLAILSSTFATYGSFVPFQLRNIDFEQGITQFKALQWRVSRSDFAANVLLMFPCGFLWMGAFTLNRPSRWLYAVSAVLVWCGCVTLAITDEVGQTFIQRRVPSHSDIAAQGIGGALGIIGWCVFGQTIRLWLLDFLASRDTRRKRDWILELYLIGFLFYHLLPLDLIVSVSELGHKYLSGRISLTPFGWFDGSADAWWEIFRDIVIYVPIGVSVAVWRTSSGHRVRPLAHSLVLGLSIAIFVEMLQVFIRSRYADMGDIILAGVGVLIGASAAILWRQGDEPPTDRAAARVWLWTLIGILYACVLVVPFWWPFDFTTDTAEAIVALKGMLVTPFRRLIIGNSPMQIIVLVLRNVMWFVPLGLIMARVATYAPRPFRTLLISICLLFMVGIGVVIESGQVLVSSRVADLSDVLLYVGGAAFGFVIGLRAFRSRDDEQLGESQSEPRPVRHATD